MNKTCMRSLMAAGILTLLAGCTDNNYDLSDIDTTVGLTVDNLVIPINLEKIKLESVLKTDDIEVVNGQYAIIREGDFNSEDVNIPAISLVGPKIQPSETIINLIGGGMTSTKAAIPSSFSYNLANESDPFEYESSLVSDFIVKIDYIGCEMTLEINITMRGLEGIVNRVTFNGVVLQLPKGLDLTSTEGGTYDATTGLLTLPDRTISNTALHLSFAAKGVDFSKIDGKYDYASSKVEFRGAMYIKEGKATIALADIKGGNATSLPSQVTLRTEPSVSDINVTTFSGSVKYNIDGSNLSEVSLSDLPDVLSQGTTNLVFVNPQIYLNINNPLQDYKLYARTGIEINAYHGEEVSSYSLDNPWFQIGPDNADGIYNFCLSPDEPVVPEADFTPLTHVGFKSLRNVLSGDGIPDKLQINLTDPNVPVQPVVNFPLGTNLGALHGKYRFVAPLQFGVGSQIVYNHTMDGWSSDDLEYLTIKSLEVSLDVTTDLPVAVKFTGYPIDSDGNRIGNVEIVGADINAAADNQHVVIRITGEIRHLDGITFEAYATAEKDWVLTPDMEIELKNVRPVVTGYYEKEL